MSMDAKHKPIDFADALRQREQAAAGMAAGQERAEATGQERAEAAREGRERREEVDHPRHYRGADDPFETIKVIEAWGLNFNLGNCVKYISRCDAKGSRLVDMRKAAWYLAREIATAERVAPPPSAERPESGAPAEPAPPLAATTWVVACDGAAGSSATEPTQSLVGDVQHRSCRVVWFLPSGAPDRVCSCSCLLCSQARRLRGNPRKVPVNDGGRFEGRYRLETDTDDMVRAHAAASAASPHPGMPVVSGPEHAPPAPK